MTTLPRTLLFALPLLALGGSAGVTQQIPNDDPDSNMVLTDRKPFCDVLQRKVAALQHSVVAPHDEADWLASEGRHMCASGHVPQGIRRLRYALMELMELMDEH